MVIRNCRGLLSEILSLEDKIMILTKIYPDLDQQLILEIINKKEDPPR